MAERNEGGDEGEGDKRVEGQRGGEREGGMEIETVIGKRGGQLGMEGVGEGWSEGD